MENEIRYYLRQMLACMGVKSDITEDMLVEGCENLQPFEPTYLITAVKLPTGAIELAVNNCNIKEKIEYILNAYDDDMRLKTNTNIVMQNIMVV